MAERAFRAGDRVRWKSHGGVSAGRVVQIVTRGGTIGNFRYRATRKNPKYIVETDDGSRAAHNEDALEMAS